MRKPEPSVEEIARHLAIDPASPSGLAWQPRPETPEFVARRRNRQAGTRKPNGYWRVMINGKWWYAHRLVWILHHGTPIPEGHEVDHRDGNNGDNRPGNLRLARPAENKANRKHWGALGHRNIRYNASRPKSPYLVEINRMEGGIRCCLSRSFPTLGEAIEWRDEMRALTWGDFAHRKEVTHAAAS